MDSSFGGNVGGGRGSLGLESGRECGTGVRETRGGAARQGRGQEGSAGVTAGEKEEPPGCSCLGIWL